VGKYIGFKATIEKLFEALQLDVREGLAAHLKLHHEATEYAKSYYQTKGKQKRKNRIKKKI